YNFLRPGEAVTAVKYCHEIDKMHKKLKDLCLILVNLKGPILLHDNARPHVSQITVQKLNELGYETLPHPPYSPDISPTDYFHLFRALRKNFKTFGDVKSAIDSFFSDKSQDFYKRGIMQLPQRWEKVIDNDGKYVVRGKYKLYTKVVFVEEVL
ncbi:Histone-lysine N-methyltransferase SETMAR, partial [Habropoda laboriosa]